MKVLVVGKNSVLAKIFKKYTSLKNIDFINHNSIDNLNYKNYSHVINFAYHPSFWKKKYKKKLDIDYKIAKKLNHHTIFVMLSSRFVYCHDAKIPFSENIKKRPMNNYGKNKVIIENNLSKIVKKKLLILRLGTLIYFSLKKKYLFMNIMLNYLKSKQIITFDLNKNIVKDFLTDKIFVKILDKLIKKKVTGKYNISSGIPINPIDIANSVIKGYGRGKIKYKAYKKKDKSFVLNIIRIKKEIRFKLTYQEILNYCEKIGKKLKNA